MIHELKCWPPHFQDIIEGSKRFELRYDDRNFKEGDVLFLREYDPNNDSYTMRSFKVRVIHLTRDTSLGLQDRYVCMSIRPIGDQAMTN